MKLFSLLTFFLSLILASSANSASFSKEQIKDHPCLDETSLPWRISPIKKKDIPEAYEGWSGLWSGHWGGTLCHVLVINKISAEGIVDFTYSTGRPYYSYGDFVGTIKKDGNDQKLEATLGYGAKVTYTLVVVAGESPVYLLKGTYQGTSSGTFKSVETDE